MDLGKGRDGEGMERKGGQGTAGGWTEGTPHFFAKQIAATAPDTLTGTSNF